VPAGAGGDALPGVWLQVRPSTHAKCVRCWHRVPDVGSHAEHPELCGRCVGNISGQPEVRRHV
jgi:isoleucyl-tRNA synthetase